MGKKESRRKFTKGAVKHHKKNTRKGLKRGGTRL